ncbi:MAG: hypothetical protein L6Q78_11075 [Bacteroidia bacterium]|nr:hypothetical protein [Bacteroidia bacterium]
MQMGKVNQIQVMFLPMTTSAKEQLKLGIDVREKRVPEAPIATSMDSNKSIIKAFSCVNERIK